MNVDRTRADQLGVTERDVTNSLSTTLAGSGQTAAGLLAEPAERRLLSDRRPDPAVQGRHPVGPRQRAGHLQHGREPDPGRGRRLHPRRHCLAVISHYAIAPAYDLFATPQDRDLGAVAADIQKILKDTAKDLPKGATITLRGQVETMNSAFSGLLLGLLGAVVLIYLIVVVNFQSWLDPFVIITALPGALAGIVWMLFATGTTLSVPALTGAIMCMGVATANSILVVSFCREQLEITGERGAGGDRGRVHALSSCADDSARHDHRHGAYGAGAG